MYKGSFEICVVSGTKSTSFTDVTVEVVGDYIRVTDRVQKPTYVEVELLGIFPIDKFYLIKKT